MVMFWCGGNQKGSEVTHLRLTFGLRFGWDQNLKMVSVLNFFFFLPLLSWSNDHIKIPQVYFL